MSGRSQQLAAFYAQHALSLQQTVRASLIAPTAVIEDACQTAWTVLLRRPDVPLDRQGLAWLRKAALTNGYRAARGRDLPAGTFLPDPEHPGELPEPVSPDHEPAPRAVDRLNRRAQLASISSPPTRSSSRTRWV